MSEIEKKNHTISAANDAQAEEKRCGTDPGAEEQCGNDLSGKGCRR